MKSPPTRPARVAILDVVCALRQHLREAAWRSDLLDSLRDHCGNRALRPAQVTSPHRGTGQTTSQRSRAHRSGVILEGDATQQTLVRLAQCQSWVAESDLDVVEVLKQCPELGDLLSELHRLILLKNRDPVDCALPLGWQLTASLQGLLDVSDGREASENDDARIGKVLSHFAEQLVTKFVGRGIARQHRQTPIQDEEVNQIRSRTKVLRVPATATRRS